MKKIIYLIPILCSLLFVGQVKAENLTFDYSILHNIPEDFTSFSNFIEDNKSIFIELYDLLFKEYNNNYKNNYPYYVLSIESSPLVATVNGSTQSITLYLLIFDEPVYINPSVSLPETYLISDNSLVSYGSEHYKILGVNYLFDQGYVLPEEYNNSSLLPFHLSFIDGIFVGNSFIESNFNIPVKLGNDNDILTINDFKNTGSEYILNHGDNIPILYKTNGFIDSFTNYTEVNLNDYSYIALSLKNYDQEPFDVYFNVKGQFCATPVYNYGMTSKDSITNNKVEDRCSLYYDDFTSFRFFILDSDLKNNSIYYLKSYDNTKDNIVKIDTNIFDISYITEEEKDNPYVLVNGKKYPTIPYDELPSTATKNEQENYIPGKSEDFNFSDIFTSPLDFLKDVWDSISSVFDLIAELFSLLPEPIKTFLIISFTLAVVLGLIKIIL